MGAHPGNSSFRNCLGTEIYRTPGAGAGCPGDRRTGPVCPQPPEARNPLGLGKLSAAALLR